MEAERTEVGYGEFNTTMIFFAFGLQEPYEDREDYAARLARSLVHEHEGTTYSDWFLPTRDELDLMHRNLHQEDRGGFSSETYWSSSETLGNNAERLDFSDGTNWSSLKINEFHVRAARTIE